jgi:type VI secretion system secreted protein VgrG
MMSQRGGSKLDLSVTVASGDALDVRRFSVAEGISSLFTVSLVVFSDSDAIDFDAVVGKAACFVLRGERITREWSGICSQIQQTGFEESGLSIYELTLVPELWLTTQRRNYRVFQQLSEPEIVERLLKEWRIDFDAHLTGVYKRRKYRVQYAESDYAFLCRMLEDAGISFYFAEDDGASRLVLSDAPQRNAPREPRIPFKDETSMSRGEYVRPRQNPGR